MKKVYTKPVIEFEEYELSASIAANCGSVVTLGPGDSNGDVCEEFEGDFDVASYALTRSSGTSFYDGETGSACDCYYSSGGQGYFTS